MKTAKEKEWWLDWTNQRKALGNELKFFMRLFKSIEDFDRDVFFNLEKCKIDKRFPVIASDDNDDLIYLVNAYSL